MSNHSIPSSILDDETSMLAEEHTIPIPSLSSSLQLSLSSSMMQTSQSPSTLQLSSSSEPLTETGSTRLQLILPARPSLELSAYVTTRKGLNDQARQEARAIYNKEHGREHNQQTDNFCSCHLKRKRSVKNTLICRLRRKLYVNKLERAVTLIKKDCMLMSTMKDKLKAEIHQKKQCISNALSRYQPAIAYSQSVQFLLDNSLRTSPSSSESTPHVEKPYQVGMLDTDTFELHPELLVSHAVPTPLAVDYKQMDSAFLFNIENLLRLNYSSPGPDANPFDELHEE